MFYSLAEKQKNRFFNDWPMRVIAVDTTRRYLYYSEPGSPLLEPQQQGAELNANNDNHHPPEIHPSPHLVWSKKIKLHSVMAVATEVEFSFSDPHLVEQDLYQLEICGDTRPMAHGECPPLGPLLCPSAGLLPMPLRNSVENREYLQDPFFLRELFTSMREHYDSIAATREEANNVAIAQGLTPAPSTTATLASPRTSTGIFFSSSKRITTRLRCRDEREFRRLWYVLQTMLGYDKLILRPYRGLPPYDPRNGISFAHVPMTVWHTFKTLDKAVFYIFTRVKVMGPSTAGAHKRSGSNVSASAAAVAATTTPRDDVVGVVFGGAYLCITHDMILIMAQNAKILRWLPIQEVHTFAYNSRGSTPFGVFRTDAPRADLIFSPQAPIFGEVGRNSFDGRVEIRRIQTVLHDTCFASLSPRRVMKIVEVADATYHDYIARQSAAGQPLSLRPRPGFQSDLSCPLPKEQLAAVWHQVQEELRTRGDVSNHAAIPIYETTAADVELAGDGLADLVAHLNREREDRHDIVGMPLAQAQQRQREAAAAAAAAVGTSSSSPPAASAQTGTRPASLTLEMLQTPLIAGNMGASQPTAEEVLSPRSSRCAPSEYTSYGMPGARYITQSELHEMENVAVEEEEDREVASADAQQPQQTQQPRLSSEASRESMKRNFVYGPDCTVDDIIRRSMAAMASDGSPLNAQRPSNS